MPNSAKVAEIYVELQANTAKFKQALGDATAATKKYTAQMRAEMKQSQDSVRLLSEEMGLGIPRSLQRVISTLPGVSKALNLAFDGVVVFALITTVVKVTEKIVEFAQKSQEAARKNADDWQSLQGSMQLTNDELQVTNDKIANAIAKLENKPTNGLKLAIDEAIESADKLGSKLTDDVKKIADTLKAQEPGLWGLLNASSTDTSDVTKHAQGLQDNLSQIDINGRAHLEELKKQGATQKQIDDATDQLDAARKAAIDKELSTWVAPQLADAKAKMVADQANGGYAASVIQPRISALTNYGASLGQESDFIGLSHDNATVTGQQDAITAAKEAVANRLQLLEQEIDQRKALHQISLGEEVLYWQKEASTFTVGSKEYIAALQKASEAGDELLKNFGAKGQLKKLSDTVANGPTAPSGYVVDSEGGLDRSKDGDDVLAAATEKAAESQALLNAQLQVEKDKLDLATGAITPHAAALDESVAHALEYKNQLADLNKELQGLEVNDAMNAALGGNTDNEAKESQLRQQISALQSKAQIQSLTDAQQTLNTTWTGMVDSVWDELIRKAEDVQQELQQIATRTIDSLNTEIAKAMTGHKANFKSVFENSAQSLAKTGLQTAEGFGAKLLGLPTHKKADGYHVFVDNMPSGGGGVVPGLSTIDSVLGKYSAHVTSGPSAISAGAGGLIGMLNDSDWASSLFGGKLFGSGSIFGHFATGGDVTGGLPIEVGELGKERFIPPSNGRIIPNKDLHSAPSIGYIDARGTDPALTRANFTRALAMTHASAVSDAQRSIVERQRRRPQ
jgi:hypothetical protein